MTKLRSLIFRELKVSKKLYIMRFLFLFAFIAFAIAGTFLFNGIFAEMPGKEKIIKTFTEMLSMLIMLCSTVFFADDTAFKSDLVSGWNNYSYVLPLTAAERAIVKLICFIGALGISVLFGMACVILINLIAGTQFEIGYVVLLFILIDFMLLSKIIINYFVLRARNTDEYKKMKNTGSFICLASLICITLVILKCAGFDFAALFNSDSSEPLSFDIISTLTGEMLLWLIPLTIVLFAVLFAVIYHHSQYVYSGGVKIKKEKVKAEKSLDIAAPHSEPVGFLYKELRQNRKSIFTVIVLPFLIQAFLTLVIAILSFSDKSGGDDWIIRTLTSDLIRIVAIALGFLSVSGLLLSVFHGDDKKLWAYFTASAPQGVKKYLYTKYVLSFAMCGLYFVSSYVAETLVATIRWFAIGEEMGSLMSISVIVFFALIFMNSFVIPLMLRFGEKRGSLINGIIILSLAIVAILVLSILPRDIQDKVFEWLTGFMTGEHGDLTMLLIGIFPALSVGVYILSYKISCKIFMKGVNEYDK